MNKMDIEIAVAFAKKAEERARRVLSENKPRAQWNWWNSGKLMNADEVIPWQTRSEHLDSLTRELDEDPSIVKARDLCEYAAKIQNIYAFRDI